MIVRFRNNSICRVWTLSVIVLITVITTCHSAWAQHVRGCMGNCQGRCLYGVEGSCKPNQTTFGYYQSSWRKWPEPAPPIQRHSSSSTGTRGNRSSSELPELPEPSFETELNPEFPHLRNRPSGAAAGAANMRKIDPSMEQRDDIQAEIEDAPEFDLPDPELEGASQGRNHRFSSYRHPSSAATKRHVDSGRPAIPISVQQGLNPLRGTAASIPSAIPSHFSSPASAAMPMHQPPQIRPAIAIDGARTYSPLRPSAANPLR